MTTIDLPAISPCPSCGHPFDQVTSVDHDNPPGPGDLTVCIRCAAILRLDQTLQHRVVPTEELDELPGYVLARLLEIRAAINATTGRAAALQRQCPECKAKGRVRRIDSGPPPAMFCCGVCGFEWTSEVAT